VSDRGIPADFVAAGAPPRVARGLFVEWVGLLMLAMAAVAIASVSAPLGRFDDLIYDWLLRVKPQPPDDDILIVAIDNRSVRSLGRWPWPRTYHARLLDQLQSADVAAIGYDVLFTEPDRVPGGDVDLAAALRRSGRVALPYLIEVPGYDGSASRIVVPAAPLADAALLGHAVIRPDRDGVVRAMEQLRLPDGVRLPQLADETLRLVGRRPVARVAPPPSGAPILMEEGRRIRFREGPEGYAQVSFVDVMEGRVPREFLRGRIILVGATAAGLGDRYATPMSGPAETMAGVEVIANYIESRQQDDLIRLAPPLVTFLFAGLPVLLLMLGLLRFSPRVNLWLGLMWAVLTLLASATSLATFNLWLPPGIALVAIALLYPLWGWRRLDFANRVMAEELEALMREPAVLPRQADAPPPAGDPVTRQVMMMHAAIRDIRDLKRFVAESLDSLPDAALVTDLDGTILIANNAADALFAPRLSVPLVGLPVAEAFTALHRGDPAMKADAAEALAVILAGTLPPEGGREWTLEDGTILDMRLAFFSDDDRRPLGWILRFVDISAIRAAERQREEALRLLTHDMRAPQASILAMLESEGEQVPPTLRARLTRYASQTLALADQYVQFARAETLRPARDLFDLNEAVLDAVDDLYPLARARGTRLVADVPGDESLVRGDRSLVTRAVLNLVGNAIKYGDRKGRVEARVSAEGRDLLFEVSDTGRGIAPEDLPGLFEPFRRIAAPDGHAAEPGSGLGLAFVKRVVERHAGEVFVRSTPGVGSTFGFRLPAAGGARPDQAAAAAATPAPAARARAAS
jgi:CHASE2 domain-containing sensor protein/nitrogen-specific signal transduction histidine kinase